MSDTDVLKNHRNPEHHRHKWVKYKFERKIFSMMILMNSGGDGWYLPVISLVLLENHLNFDLPQWFWNGGLSKKIALNFHFKVFTLWLFAVFNTFQHFFDSFPALRPTLTTKKNCSHFPIFCTWTFPIHLRPNSCWRKARGKYFQSHHDLSTLLLHCSGLWRSQSIKLLGWNLHLMSIWGKWKMSWTHEDAAKFF